MYVRVNCRPKSKQGNTTNLSNLKKSYSGGVHVHVLLIVYVYNKCVLIEGITNSVYIYHKCVLIIPCAGRRNSDR